ncbi:hypothetical protein LTR86_011158 [Recurvomyces mirabilis]|nr:hypothetical protein LTR86_011158 [Recurvomyces mirabilis]
MDPLSITAGVIALVSFGVQTGKSLAGVINSIDNHTKVVRDLRAEVQDLQDILQQLHETITPADEAIFVQLKVPLYSCATSCQDFATLINQCTANTTDRHKSVRDWTRLQLRASDIAYFRSALSGYKSTIQVALGGINLKTAKLTLECLQKYEALIKETRADLIDHLERTQSRSVSSAALQLPSSTHCLEARSQQERDSTAACLEICEKVSKLVEQHRVTIMDGLLVHEDTIRNLTTVHDTASPSASQLTASALDECSKSMGTAKESLTQRIQAMKQSVTSPKESSLWVRQCLELLEEASRGADQARSNIFEDLNYADDSRNILVSTVGDLICAKRVTTGARSVLVAGQMSDESLQLSFQHLAPTANKTSDQEISDQDVEAPFERYGSGHHLGDDHVRA